MLKIRGLQTLGPIDGLVLRYQHVFINKKTRLTSIFSNENESSRTSFPGWIYPLKETNHQLRQIFRNSPHSNPLQVGNNIGVWLTNCCKLCFRCVHQFFLNSIHQTVIATSFTFIVCLIDCINTLQKLESDSVVSD